MCKVALQTFHILIMIEIITSDIKKNKYLPLLVSLGVLVSSVSIFWHSKAATSLSPSSSAASSSSFSDSSRSPQELSIPSPIWAVPGVCNTGLAKLQELRKTSVFAGKFLCSLRANHVVYKLGRTALKRSSECHFSCHCNNHSSDLSFALQARN